MNYDTLITTLAQVHQQAQAGAAGAVNRHHILRNWLIGAYLVEFEQHGEDRAKYGAGLLERVSADLRRHDIPGTSTQMLERMRLFYTRYPQMSSAISSSAMRISSSLLPARELAIPSSPPVELPVGGLLQIRQSVIGESTSPEKSSPPVSELPDQPRALPPVMVLRFSWTHLLEIIRLDDPWKRAFYENECLKGNWSVRQLQRQIGSLLYERTGLSTDKHAVIEAARQQAADAPGQIADLIRDPYVLEFTGLADQPRCHETDLETALLDHLQSFLLELGTGFCFEARQKRITVGNEHDYLDLVSPDQGGIRHRRLGPATVCLPLPRGPAQARTTPATHRNRPRRVGTAAPRTSSKRMTMLSDRICLRVKGPFVCFTRPGVSCGARQLPGHGAFRRALDLSVGSDRI